MGKFLVRLTIVLVAIYLTLTLLLAQFAGIDILMPYYYILFEVCAVVYCFSEGKYHCKYMKYTALSVLISDIVTHMDNAMDFLSVEGHNFIPIVIIFLGISASATMAIRHFILVLRLKRRLHGRNIED